MCSFQLSRKHAFQGYLWRAENAWHPFPSSPASRQAAEGYLKAQLGDEHGYSIPDDMDFYIVDRREITDTPLLDR